GSVLGCAFQKFVHQWNQRGDAFEGETLGAQISLLQNQLEKIGSNEQIEGALLFNFGLRSFQSLLDPAAAFGVRDVGELDANGSAINATGFLGELAFHLQVRM